MYPLRSLNVPLGVHVPQFGNPCSSPSVDYTVKAKSKKFCKIPQTSEAPTAMIKKLAAVFLTGWVLNRVHYQNGAPTYPQAQPTIELK